MQGNCSFYQNTDKSRVDVSNSPVHGNRYSLLIKVPSAQQVCTRKVRSVKPPSTLDGGGLKSCCSVLFRTIRIILKKVVLEREPGWGKLQGYAASQNASADVALGLLGQSQSPGSPTQTQRSEMNYSSTFAFGKFKNTPEFLNWKKCNIWGWLKNSYFSVCSIICIISVYMHLNKVELI